MVQTKDAASEAIGVDRAATNGAPKQRTVVTPGDMRRLIPPLGLREYWYPALEDQKVKSTPVGLTICGTELVFFRDRQGQVQSLWNVCPHRGGSLMHGDCHFPGTISCPYHGWTFDGEGNVLAVLPEGPDSRIPGRVRARKHPTRTLKGMVFVWMGDGEPAPIEEDVPPELFDDTSIVLFHTEYWPVQWNIALENGGDAHVPYVHRNAVRQLMGRVGFASPVGGPQKIVNGRAVVPQGPGANGPAVGPAGSNGSRPAAAAPYQRYFPQLEGHWPKHRWRLAWTWIFGLSRRHTANLPPWDWPEEWIGGHHLPGMYRRSYGTDYYTRQSVPVNDNLSRQIYYKTLRPMNRVGQVWEAFINKVYYRWAMYTNFSKQDFRAVAHQRYDTPEHLSPTDIHQIYWRRLVLQARGMMKREDVEAVPATDAEQFSHDLVQRKEAAVKDSTATPRS